MSVRQYLAVPFSRKDEARQHGARWDKKAKRWYWNTLYGGLPAGLQSFAVPMPPQADKPARQPAPAPRIDLHFDSLATAIAELDRPCCLHANDRTKRIKLVHLHDSLQWFGVEGGSNAVRRCLDEGWPEGTARIERFLESIDTKLPIAAGVNRMLVRSDNGDHLDVHAMYRGNLDKAWSSSKRRLKKQTGLVRICVDICANYDTQADTLAWRGVAGAAMARLLEKARYSVEISACMALSGYIEDVSSSKLTATFVVKPKTGRVDLGRLACTVGLAGFFRTVGFAAAIHAADDAGLTVNNDLGRYADVSGLLPPNEKTMTLWVPQSVCSEETAVQWFKETVRLLQAAG